LLALIGIFIGTWVYLPSARAAEVKTDAIALGSSAFETRATVPRKYSCDCENLSPMIRRAGGFGSHRVVYDAAERDGAR